MKLLLSQEVHMRGKTWLAALILSGASALAFAQQTPSKPAPGTMGGGMMGGQGMGDMGGMMNMMRGCESMMGSHAGAMPKMPPGNEKLEFQMHAEMMQKMGEIAAKYAERMRDGK
jgi:hypothetical protein